MAAVDDGATGATGLGAAAELTRLFGLLLRGEGTTPGHGENCTAQRVTVSPLDSAHTHILEHRTSERIGRRADDSHDARGGRRSPVDPLGRGRQAVLGAARHPEA